MNGLRSIAYTSTRIFKLEQEHIFRKAWLPISVTQDLANRRTPFELPDRSFFLQGGKAFVNSCTHRLTRLVHEQEDATNVVRCRYHNWCFKDGVLVKAPGLSQQPTCELNLPKLPATTVGNIQYVMLTPTSEEPCLPEFGIHAELGKFSDFEPYWACKYEVSANWKHIVENFLDYLHVPAIHPSLAPSSKIDDHYPSPSVGKHIAFHTHPIRPSKKNPLTSLHVPDGRLCADKLYFHVLFPNCFLFTHPTHMFAVFVDPVSPGTSVERAFLLLNKDTKERTDKGTLDQLATFYDDVNKEDISVVEHCQAGSYGRNRYNKILLPTDKYLYAFQEMYRAALPSDRSTKQNELQEVYLP